MLKNLHQQGTTVVDDTPPPASRSLLLLLLCGCCQRGRCAKSSNGKNGVDLTGTKSKRDVKHEAADEIENGRAALCHVPRIFKDSYYNSADERPAATQLTAEAIVEIPLNSTSLTARTVDSWKSAVGDMPFETARTSRSDDSQNSEKFLSMTELVQQIRREAGCDDADDKDESSRVNQPTSPSTPRRRDDIQLHVEETKNVTSNSINGYYNGAVQTFNDDMIKEKIVATDDIFIVEMATSRQLATAGWSTASASSGAWLLHGASLVVRLAYDWLTSALSSAFQKLF